MITRLRKEGYDTDELCGAMEVSRSGYYAHRQKPEGKRRQEDSALRPIVAAAFAQSRETYGTPRLREVVSGLTEAPISRARIAQLMDELGIAPRQKRAFIPRTTIADPAATPAPNLLLDRPPTTGINQVWVTDITYIPTREGWLYLAAVMNIHSRRILDWATAPHMRAELVAEALQRARFTRFGQRLEGVVAHSDCGSQYTSAAWQKSLSLLRMTSSMSRTANGYDNAIMESFWASLKAEALHRIFATRTEAELMIHDHIDAFHSTHRVHNSIAFQSPIAFEQSFIQHLN